jgi:hypothetical protein
MGNLNKPDLRLYIGGTGSGKGVAIRQALDAEKPTRLLVWDPMDEYRSFTRTASSMAELVRNLIPGPWAVRWCPKGAAKVIDQQFDLFCRAAMAVGDCVVLVEELSQVTQASHAPPAWAKVVQQGRHRGLKVWAATQRPASCDKDFLSGTTLIRAHAMRYPADQKATANAMGLDVGEIAALETVESGENTTINYIEKHFRTGEVLRKSITLSRTGSGKKSAPAAKKSLKRSRDG